MNNDYLIQKYSVKYVILNNLNNLKSYHFQTKYE